MGSEMAVEKKEYVFYALRCHVCNTLRELGPSGLVCPKCDSRIILVAADDRSRVAAALRQCKADEVRVG